MTADEVLKKTLRRIYGRVRNGITRLFQQDRRYYAKRCDHGHPGLGDFGNGNGNEESEMTLKEFFEQNGNKPIEIREDGTIRILEEKGPWKPECEEKYYTIYGCGSVETFKWVDCLMDDLRKEMGNVFQTKAEAERMVHRLKARKKFLDAGGHEGMDGLVFGDRYNAYPQRCDKTLIVAKEGSVTAFDIWFETEADCNRAIDSLTKDEVAALCWTGDEE